MNTTDEPIDSQSALFEKLQNGRLKLEAELSKVIVGQKEVTRQLLIALLSGGHCIVTGAPGLAKTLLVKSISQVFQLNFQRIQFTPDLMPADITGTEILTDTPTGRQMTFVRGPVFTNLLLADEINRTPPKTQSALLEAMQEHQVTAAGARHTLQEPFFVLATQNPVEMEGTYPLPEAQLDRFLFNVLIDYLPEEDEIEVVRRTTAGPSQRIEPVFTAQEIIAMQALVREVPISSDVIQYAVQLVARTRPESESAPDYIRKYVQWGAGTRAAQALVLASKALALWEGKAYASKEQIKSLAKPVLRHRILLNYRAEAESTSVEQIIEKLVE
ncbi:MoxR family ATPase [Pelagicoccus sp. SDUM812003]|uniref:AAA family ATPase n=1 Tax=Pelagicoccus sp. SDUM812003 TaxID=3041267 RepID=UPI00280FD6C4|nr:MoxR family ATPase [Pelagicoccus sp. SDUM812003]MDQ8204020.1 MoxR family ATPase [Pelagicoccus sp. SDUM812003]